MAGDLTIPNVINNLPGYPPTRNSATLLDDNWSEIADYVNARQISFDVIANRPTAGVAGRFFFASDEGNLYADTGVTWVQIGAGGEGGGGIGTESFPSSLGQYCEYQSGAPEKFDLDATTVLTTDLNSSISKTHPNVSVTIDITTVGANGRDSVAALAANSWAHLYYIYNPDTDTVAGIASASAWPTAFPTFPAGYTQLAYAGAVRISGASVFEAMSIHGRWSQWAVAQSVLSAGTANVVTAVSVATKVAPNALRIQGSAYMQNSADPGGTGVQSFGKVGAVTLFATAFVYFAANGAAAGEAVTGGYWECDNRSQTLQYIVDDGAGGVDDAASQFSLSVTAFENPNGAN
jgi:hypothetical protein